VKGASFSSRRKKADADLEDGAPIEEEDGGKKNAGASFRKGAELILRRAGKPLDAREIVRIGLEEGLFSTRGKTPQNTLASLLYVDIKNNKKCIFTKVRPMTFGLKEFGA